MSFNKKRWILVLFLLGLVWKSQAQCAQTLRLARSTYEQGHLQELEGLLTPCLNLKDGFTKEEKVEAYKLLTLAYIYLEEPAKADEMMTELLRSDHFFEVNDDVDPAEFKALYSTFRTWPLFSLGLKLGPNAAMPAISKVYYVGADGAQNGHYSPGISFQAGLVFEKDLTHLEEKVFLSRLSACPELIYSNLATTYSNAGLTESDETGSSNSNIEKAEFVSTWFNLNLLMKMKIRTDPQFSTFVTAGPGLHYLSAATGTMQTVVGEGSVETGPSIDVLENHNVLNFSAIVGAGLTYKFGDFYLAADLRYSVGLKNAIDPEHRSNENLVFDRMFIFDDFTINRLSANIGFILPIFSPKKISN